jgi:hypothetical protein
MIEGGRRQYFEITKTRLEIRTAFMQGTASNGDVLTA